MLCPWAFLFPTAQFAAMFGIRSGSRHSTCSIFFPCRLLVNLLVSFILFCNSDRFSVVLEFSLCCYGCWVFPVCRLGSPLLWWALQGQFRKFGYFSGRVLSTDTKEVILFLQRIQGDICGPIHPYCGPFRYFMVLVDASTRWTHVALLSTWNAAFTKLLA